MLDVLKRLSKVESVIDNILKYNKELFGESPKVDRINVGFTNTLFVINDKYVVKIFTNKDNEDKFINEINFYNAKVGNNLIPKLYYASVDKNNVSYYYEIIEKIDGVSLYSVWHTLSELERENIIKKLCDAMKKIHSNIGNSYDWTKHISDIFIDLYEKSKNLFSDDEIELLNKAYARFSEFLDSKEFVLVHNDLHFDNIFYNDGEIKLIDFERSMYAPMDFELDILYRMIRKPWKFAQEDIEEYTKLSDYENIMSYIEKYYPEQIHIDNLYKRLAIYDIVYYLRQYINCPKLDELKEDVLEAARIVIS